MTKLLTDALLGAQRPRVCNLPAFSTSAGDEAVDLASRFGLVLDPWEVFVLQNALGERADGAWAAFEVGLLAPRQNGKGSILEARELAGLFLFGERKITHSAHELKTSKDHFNRMESLLRNGGYGDDLIHYRRSNEEVSITVRKTGNKLLFLTRTTGGGRGLGGDLVVMDEAYALNNDMMAALMPTMSARTITGNPQLWYTSSAGFEYSDVLSKVREDGESGVDRMAYFDWSAPPDADSDDREAWAQANPGLGIRISEEYIVTERRRMGEEEFRRERLGIWADNGLGEIISASAWLAVADEQSRRVGSSLIFAIDAEEDRSASIVVGARNAHGKTHIELIDPGRSMTVPQAGERLVQLAARHKPRMVPIRATSPAASLVPTLRQRGVPVVTIGAQEWRAACGGFLDGVNSRELAHTGQQHTLTESVVSGRKHTTATGWEWRDTAGCGPLKAATLAYFKASTMPRRTRVVGY